jgi:hypothetical protein
MTSGLHEPRPPSIGVLLIVFNLFAVVVSSSRIIVPFWILPPIELSRWPMDAKVQN